MKSSENPHLNGTCAGHTAIKPRGNLFDSSKFPIAKIVERKQVSMSVSRESKIERDQLTLEFTTVEVVAEDPRGELSPSLCWL